MTLLFVYPKRFTGPPVPLDGNWHRESSPGRIDNRRKEEFITSPSVGEPQQCVLVGKIWDSRHISGSIERRRRRDDNQVS